jgi:hypothetical protein
MSQPYNQNNDNLNNDTMVCNLRDELSSLKSMVKMKDDRIEYLSNQVNINNSRLKDCQDENFK